MLIAAEPRPGAALVSVFGLLLVAGCAVLAAAVPSWERGALLPVGVTAVGFVLLAVLYVVQVRSARLHGIRVRGVRTDRLSDADSDPGPGAGRASAVRLWLLFGQALLTFVLLVADGWLWHGVSGLLAGAVLVVLGGRVGAWSAVVLSAGLLPAAVALALTPQQLVHWLTCHAVVAVGTWGFLVLVGMLRRQGREQRELAQNARERERTQIATGLHDILGRTLVALALKGEVVHRLAQERPESGRPELARAARGLVDLAREARADVRSAVTSSWRTTVAEELELARAVLADASVELAAEVDGDAVPAGAEWVLASALREAVTNVLVHSDARRLELGLAREGAWVVLRVYDDGTARVGGPVVHGTGLRGVAARCTAVGGRMGTEAASAGFTLTCRVPVEP